MSTRSLQIAILNKHLIEIGSFCANKSHVPHILYVCTCAICTHSNFLLFFLATASRHLRQAREVWRCRLRVQTTGDYLLTTNYNGKNVELLALSSIARYVPHVETGW